MYYNWRVPVEGLTQGSARFRSLSGSMNLRRSGAPPKHVDDYVNTDGREVFRVLIMPHHGMNVATLRDECPIIEAPSDKLSGNTLHWTGFPLDWSEEDLIRLALAFGIVIAVNFARYWDGCPEGSGLIKFRDLDAAKACVDGLMNKELRSNYGSSKFIWISFAKKEIITAAGFKGVEKCTRNRGFGPRISEAGDESVICPNTQDVTMAWMHDPNRMDNKDLCMKTHPRNPWDHTYEKHQRDIKDLNFPPMGAISEFWG